MDTQTLELIRVLQAGPFDNATFQEIRRLLADERQRLMAQGDRATISDLVDLLLEWSQETQDREAASLALYDGGDLAESELGDPERAANLFERSLESNPRNLKSLYRAETVLLSLGQAARLAEIADGQALALAATPGSEPPILAELFRFLGKLKAEHIGDVDGAVSAYEQALDAEADLEVVATLASLYRARGREGDAVQTADLYCTLGEMAEGQEAIDYLEQALDLAPGHEQALEILEQALPEAERAERLKGRWQAFIEHVTEGPAADARRRSLAQLYMGEERFKEALHYISPLADKGDEAAVSIREALCHMLGTESAHAPAPVNTPVKPAEPGMQAAPASAPLLSAEPAPGPPAQSGATLVGYSVPQDLKKEPAQAIESKAAPVHPTPEEVAEVELPLDDALTTGRGPRNKKVMITGALLVLAAAGGLAYGLLGGSPPDALEPGATLADGPQDGPEMADPEGSTAQGASAVASPQPEAPPSPAASGAADASLEPAAAAAEEPGAADEELAAQEEPQQIAEEQPERAVRAVAELLVLRGGKIDKAGVLESAEGTFDEMEKCYGRILKQKPRLKGRVVLAWTVKANGSPVRARRAGGTIKNAVFARCLARSVAKARFPRPKRKPALVRLPFIFERPAR